MANDQEVAFPVLSPKDLAALAARGHPRDVRAGEVLFAEGDRDFCFFVLVEGEVEIVEHSSGTPRTVVVHKAGEFTGDVDMLSGRGTLVTARAATDGRVLQLSTGELRRAVDELPELGETIVKAFLMRRTLLLDAGFEGVRIIGSRFSPEAHRLRDFATRNAIPFKCMDLETDEQADAILRQFGIPASATPIVMGRDGEWHSNPSIGASRACMGLDCHDGRGSRLRPGGRRGRPRGARRLGLRRVRGARRADGRRAGAPAGRRVPARGSRTISAFPRASPGRISPATR